MTRAVREYIITLALLAAMLAITFFPMIFQGRTILPSDLIDTMTLPFSHYFGPEHAYNSLITDGYLQFYPLKLFTKIAYEHGHFAFWNPYILNGYPQYLEGMWTYNFVLFLPFSIAFPLILLLPLLVGGMGMYALLREYNIRCGIARIFATAYMLNALFMTHLLAHFIPASFSFAPLVILFLYKHHRNAEFRNLAASAIALALGFLAGNLQTIGFLIFFVVCYWASFSILQSDRSFTLWLKPLAIVLAFAIGLSAIMLLPLLELLRETMLHGAFFSTSLLNSYTILQRIESIGLAFTFFIPQLVGSIRGVTLDQVVGVFVQDFEAAIGFLPLLLAVWTSVALWNRKKEVRPFVTLMIAGLGLPIVTPLFHFLYHRFIIIFVFGSSVTGALGLEAIFLNDVWSKSLSKWIKSFAIVLFLVTFIISAFSLIQIFEFPKIEAYAKIHLLPRLQHSVFSEGNPGWVLSRFEEALDYWRITRPEIIFGIVSSLIGLAVLNWRKRLSPPIVVIAIWIISVIQLFYFAHTWFPFNDTAQYPLYPPTPETKLLQANGRNSRTYFYREIDSTKQFAFMDNENSVYGIPEATGYESLTPRSLYMYTAVLHWQDLGHISPQFLGKFNVGTLVRVKPLPFDSIQLETSHPLWIYKNPWTFPRAYLAHSADVCANDSIVLHSLADTTLPWPRAYFTADEGACALHTPASTHDTVTLTQSNENLLSFITIIEDSSFLILTDTYYPGWEATVDGKSSPILRCNFAMRAILLPPGMHKVEMRFTPASFQIGKWASAATFIVLFFYFGIRFKKR